MIKTPSGTKIYGRFDQVTDVILDGVSVIGLGVVEAAVHPDGSGYVVTRTSKDGETKTWVDGQPKLWIIQGSTVVISTN